MTTKKKLAMDPNIDDESFSRNIIIMMLLKGGKKKLEFGQHHLGIWVPILRGYQFELVLVMC